MATYLECEKLAPEEKVALMVDMVDTCTRICADGIRDDDQTVQDEELIQELRRRMGFNKRRHPEV